jgi:hypothetical protein
MAAASACGRISSGAAIPRIYIVPMARGAGRGELRGYRLRSCGERRRGPALCGRWQGDFPSRREVQGARQGFPVAAAGMRALGRRRFGAGRYAPPAPRKGGGRPRDVSGRRIGTGVSPAAPAQRRPAFYAQGAGVPEAAQAAFHFQRSKGA